jgi:hypothetical protein
VGESSRLEDNPFPFSVSLRFEAARRPRRFVGCSGGGAGADGGAPDARDADAEVGELPSADPLRRNIFLKNPIAFRIFATRKCKKPVFIARAICSSVGKKRLESQTISLFQKLIEQCSTLPEIPKSNLYAPNALLAAAHVVWLYISCARVQVPQSVESHNRNNLVPQSRNRNTLSLLAPTATPTLSHTYLQKRRATQWGGWPVKSSYNPSK